MNKSIRNHHSRFTPFQRGGKNLHRGLLLLAAAGALAMPSSLHAAVLSGTSGSGYGSSVVTNGTNLLVGAPTGDASTEKTVSLYTDIGSLTSSATPSKTWSNTDPGFGSSLALSGEGFIIGAPKRLVGAYQVGAAYYGTTSSDELTLKASPVEGGYNYFGCSVARSGDHALAGAWQVGEAGGSTNGGAAYYYSDISGEPVEIINPNTPNAGGSNLSDMFGFSVALVDDSENVSMLIGAPGFKAGDPASRVGRAYFYPTAGSNTPVHSIEYPGTAVSGENPNFGCSVSLYNQSALIGASGAESGDDAGNGIFYSGAVYYYTISSGTPSLSAILTPTGITAESSEMYYGGSVSLDGSTALVGATGYDSDKGRAFVYYLNNVSGGAHVTTPLLILTPNEAVADAQFGRSVSLYNGAFAIGAPGMDKVYTGTLSSMTGSVKSGTSGSHISQTISDISFENRGNWYIGASADGANGYMCNDVTLAAGSTATILGKISIGSCDDGSYSTGCILTIEGAVTCGSSAYKGSAALVFGNAYLEQLHLGSDATLKIYDPASDRDPNLATVGAFISHYKFDDSINQTVWVKVPATGGTWQDASSSNLSVTHEGDYAVIKVSLAGSSASSPIDITSSNATSYLTLGDDTNSKQYYRIGKDDVSYGSNDLTVGYDKDASLQITDLDTTDTDFPLVTIGDGNVMKVGADPVNTVTGEVTVDGGAALKVGKLKLGSIESSASHGVLTIGEKSLVVTADLAVEDHGLVRLDGGWIAIAGISASLSELREKIFGDGFGDVAVKSGPEAKDYTILPSSGSDLVFLKYVDAKPYDGTNYIAGDPIYDAFHSKIDLSSGYTVVRGGVGCTADNPELIAAASDMPVAKIDSYDVMNLDGSLPNWPYYYAIRKTLDLTGAAAPSLCVGNTSKNNSLIIYIPAQVTCSRLYVGNAASSTGNKLTLQGEGGKLTCTSDSVLGVDGSGEMMVRLGADISSRDFRVGLNSGSSGKVTMEDSDTVWLASMGSLYLGDSGSGELTISDGAYASFNNAYISFGSSTGNSVTVTGTDAQFVAQNRIYVGYNSKGTLTISDGGQVSSSVADIYIGKNATSTGNTVTVTGKVSSMSADESVIIGYEGSGELTVSDGATVSGACGYVGYVSGSEGNKVTVTGADSTWTCFGELQLGRAGSGTLTIENGGTVSCGGTDSGVTYSGVGATDPALKVSSSSYIRLGKDGALMILGDCSGTGADSFWKVCGAQVQVPDGDKWKAASASDLTIKAEKNKKGHLFTTITYNPNGSAGSPHLSDKTGKINNGGTYDSAGDVDYGDSTLVVGESTKGNKATIRSGDRITSHGGVIGKDQDSSGKVTVTGRGSSWIADGDLTVGGDGEGTLALADDSLVSVDGKLKVGEKGTLQISGGYLALNGKFSADEIVASYNIQINVNGIWVDAGPSDISVHYYQDGEYGPGGALYSIYGDSINLDGCTVITAGAGRAMGTPIVTGRSDTFLNEGSDDSARFYESGDGTTDYGDTTLYVGFDTVNNFLTVNRGRGVRGDAMQVGCVHGSSGDVTVTGLITAKKLTVGNAGIGKMLVTEGGSADADTTYLGYYNGSAGSLVVDGSGSSFTSHGDLYLGVGGSGSLTVEHEGRASVGGSLQTGADGVIYLGCGTITLSGSTTAAEFLRSHKVFVYDGLQWVPATEADLIAVVNGSGSTASAVASTSGDSLVGEAADETVSVTTQIIGGYYDMGWAELDKYGDGWFDSNWFGWYFNDNTKGRWIWHVNHGWQYFIAGNAETTELYLWDNGTNSWWYTDKLYYPYMYNYTISGWFCYCENSEPERRFYDCDNKTFVQESVIKKQSEAVK